MTTAKLNEIITQLHGKVNVYLYLIIQDTICLASCKLLIPNMPCLRYCYDIFIVKTTPLLALSQVLIIYTNENRFVYTS